MTSRFFSLFITLLVASLTAQPGMAQSSWLTPNQQSLLFEDLNRRISELDLGPEHEPEAIHRKSRQAVEALADRLDRWGPEVVVQRAPAIEVPPVIDPFLSAMARYGACTFYLEVWAQELDRPTGGEDGRLATTFASFAMAMTSGYLRHHYLENGGEEELLEAYLGSEIMGRLGGEISRGELHQADTARRCRPAIEGLLADS
ncbi:MAG: hypothetical protein AAF604_01205 [Acidobacteriota bacterium]